MEKKPIDVTMLKNGIVRKIFTRPLPNDCYCRLSNAEKKFIRQNAGFTRMEMKVFELRCQGLTFDEISRKTGYHTSYCKKIAARVRKQIEALISM